MQLLTTPDEIEKALRKLMSQYSYFDWAVAWASVGFPAFQQLEKFETKSRKIVVGTHFYQTHPDFIERFAKSKTFKFILQPDGIFHPKVYLFENSATDWACVIGSANFTNAALSKNTEVVVFFDSNEPNAADLRHQVIEVIQRSWESAKVISSDELTAYRHLWTRYRPVQKRMAGEFGANPSPKPAASVTIFRYDWNTYLRKLRADPHHDFSKRMEVLRLVRDYFARGISFATFTEEQRRQVAGYAPDAEVMWRYFGSMQGAGTFKCAIRRNAPEISTAFEKIPSSGPVTEKHYDDFIVEFLKAFPKGGVKVSTATRLLAMKRPDIFVCISDKNAKLLAQDFGVAPTRLQHRFDAYWPEVIERIQETAWWQSAYPANTDEQAIWQGRAALLDAIYYDPDR